MSFCFLQFKLEAYLLVFKYNYLDDSFPVILSN